jgi:hypothetical protein
MPLSQIVSASIEDGAVAPVDLSSVAQYTGFKNRIINGGFGIWQRGTSSTTNGAYATADRWLQVSGTSGTWSRSTDVPSGFQYSMSVAGTNFPQIIQRIESVNCVDLVGQQVTFSLWVKQTSGAGANSMVAYLQYANATDNWSTSTTITGSVLSFSATTGWAQYSLTVPALPSQVANGIQIIIYANTSGAATFLTTGVQLEKGVTATSFDYRPYGTELALCQRYYQRQTRTSGVATGVEFVFCMAQMWSNAWQGYISFPVTMRVAPSFNSSAASTFVYHVAGVASSALSSIGISGASVDGTRLSGGTGYAGTQGLAAQLSLSNSSTAFLEFSAEL